MKKVGLAVLGLAWAGTLGATGETPTLRLPAQARVVRHRLDLSVNPSEPAFQGSIDIDLELLAPTSRLWLNALELTVDEAVLYRAHGATTGSAVPSGNDFVGISFPVEEPAGPATLHLTFHGAFRVKDTNGLFRQKEGDDWYVFSQFEAPDARRAFPCFDEPSYKAPWQLTLHVPRALVAASNTKVLWERDEPQGMKTVRFAETKPLPSYLVAIVVGPFDIADGGTAGENHVPIRVLAPRGRAGEAQEALAATPFLLTSLERYFGIPYPFEKLDQAAIPETVGFGAMEHPGLITYNARSLLMKPGETSVSQRRRYAETAAHEFAHQWFGNLVTLAFWDDTWLNEAFASWMERKVITDWKPEWNAEIDRVRSRRGAIAADSLVTARKVRQPIVVKDDIENAFDAITYSKGAALLTMFEAWMGEDRFRTGVRRYLQAHSYGNATAGDFLAALSAEGAPEVGPAFSSFLEQPGVPLVAATLVCDPRGARLHLRQQRFLPTGSQGSADSIWQIPVCVRYLADGEKTARVCSLLGEREADVALTEARGCPAWALANDQGIGYYVTDHQRGLLEQLLAGQGKRLTLSEQVSVIGDVSSLVDAGIREYAEVLSLVPQFAGAESRHIVTSASRIVEGIREHLVPDLLRPNYARFVCGTFGARARALGLAPGPGEDEDTQLLRSSLLDLVAVQGDDPALKGEGRQLTERWLEDRKAVDPEVVSVLLAIAAPQGDAALFDRLLAEGRRTKERRDRSRIFGALGSFRDPALQQRALELVLDPEIDPRQAGAILWNTADQPENRARTYEFVKRHFDDLARRFPEDSVPRLVFTGTAFCDEAHREDVEEFFGPRLPKFPGGAHTLERALESMDLCIAKTARQQAGVAAFLAQY